jgi:glutamine amidotransferase
MDVVIVDYGSGNLRSAAKAFERVVREQGLTQTISVTADPDRVLNADRIVLPGVGAFADCKKGLDAVSGMVPALIEAVHVRGRPFLGICVGMQLMATIGREHGDHKGLDWISGEVLPLNPADPALKVPHMGWNELILDRPDHPLLAGLGHGAHAYFVHSYHFLCHDQADRVAHVDYAGDVTAVIAKQTMAGTQFHPEKSQATGLTFIGNFLRWAP